MARGHKFGEYRDCLICKKNFYAIRAEIKKGGGKFCSGDCYHKSRVGLSSWNKGIPMRDDVKKRLSIRFMGEKNHQWRGGKVAWLSRIMKTFEYKNWRKSVYERDRYICKECGVVGNGKNLNAHHIKRVSEYPELVFDINNGITLCKHCHTKQHVHLMRSRMTQYLLK